MSQQEPHHDKRRRSRFGEWLTTWRVAAGLRQSDLAAELSISSGRISEWEQAIRVPSHEQVEKIREVFGPGVPPPPPVRRILGDLPEHCFKTHAGAEERDAA